MCVCEYVCMYVCETACRALLPSGACLCVCVSMYVCMYVCVCERRHVELCYPQGLVCVCV